MITINTCQVSCTKETEGQQPQLKCRVTNLCFKKDAFGYNKVKREANQLFQHGLIKTKNNYVCYVDVRAIALKGRKLLRWNRSECTTK